MFCKDPKLMLLCKTSSIKMDIFELNNRRSFADEFAETKPICQKDLDGQSGLVSFAPRRSRQNGPKLGSTEHGIVGVRCSTVRTVQSEQLKFQKLRSIPNSPGKTSADKDSQSPDSSFSFLSDRTDRKRTAFF